MKENKLFRNLITIGLLGFLSIGIGSTIVATSNTLKDNAHALVSESPYDYTFKSGDFGTNAGSNTFAGVKWNYSSAQYVGFDTNAQTNRGLQIGSSGKPQTTEWNISADVLNFDGDITSITINAAIATDGSAELYFYSSENEKVETKTLTTTSTDYTHNFDVAPTVVKIGMKASSKAMYIKSISVSFTEEELILDELTLDGDMTTKTYFVGDNWNRDGLTATGNPGNVDMTNKVTWSYNPTIVEEGTEQVVVTATYGELSAQKTITGITVAASKDFTLLTSENDLVSGDSIIITNGTDGAIKAMGVQKSNNRGTVDVVAQSNTISNSKSAAVLKVNEIEEGIFTLFDETESGYLYAASSSKNYLKTSSELDANCNGNWKISIGTSNVATVTAQGNYTKNIMRYNSNSTLFSCYDSGQQDIYIFSYHDTTPYISIDQADTKLFLDETLDLTATVRNENGAAVNWSIESANSAVSLVTNDTGGVTLTADNVGTAIVTASITVNDMTYSDSINIQVATKPVYTHTLNTANISGTQTTIDKYVRNDFASDDGSSTNYFYIDHEMKNGEAYLANNDSGYGVQFGSSKNPITSLTLTSGLFVANDNGNSETKEYMINTVSVVAGTATGNSGKATMTVYVEGIQAGESVTLTAASNAIIEHTFTLSTPTSGHIQIVIDNPEDGALYIKTISVCATDEDGMGDLYKTAKDLELIDSCAVTSEEWSEFLSTSNSLGTYEETFEAFGEEMSLISLTDKGNATSEERNYLVSATDKYNYINGRFLSVGTSALKSYSNDNTTTLILIIVLVLIPMVALIAYRGYDKKRRLNK